MTASRSARRMLIAALLVCPPFGARAARAESPAEGLRRGVAQFNAGDLTAALATLERARRAAREPPRVGQLELYRGLCLALLERPAEARAAFTAALRADPAVRLEPGRFGPTVEQLFHDARRAVERSAVPPPRRAAPAAAVAPPPPAARPRRAPPAPPPPPPRSARRVWTWVAVGAAAAALVAGIALGAAADSDHADWQRSVERWQQERDPQQLLALEGQRSDLASAVEGKALAANIAFAGAGVLAGVAVAAFFLEGRPETRRPGARATLRAPAVFALEF